MEGNTESILDKKLMKFKEGCESAYGECLDEVITRTKDRKELKRVRYNKITQLITLIKHSGGVAVSYSELNNRDDGWLDKEIELYKKGEY